MNAKRIVIGSLVGGVTYAAIGYLIWGRMLGGFFGANVGSATGVPRDLPVQWAYAVGNLSLALLLTLAVESRGRSASILDGFRTAAIVGFLAWLGVDFIRYGAQNVSNLSATIVSPLLEIVHAGVTGAVIAAVLGRLSTPDSAGQRPA